MACVCSAILGLEARSAAAGPRRLVALPAASAYADSVLRFDPAYGGGCVATHPNFVEPAQAVGPDDYSGGPSGTGAVSLGSGGLIELRFTPPIANSGDARLDLRIAEVGGWGEACFIALRPAPPLTAQDMLALGLRDRNQDGFYEIKRIGGGISYMDLDARFAAPAPPQSVYFDAIQIVDDPDDHSDCSTTTPGADIDAVEALDPFVAVGPGTWTRVKRLYRD